MTTSTASSTRTDSSDFLNNLALAESNDNAKATQKIRKNVEFNACELVDAILLAHKAGFLCETKTCISYSDVCELIEKWITDGKTINELKLNVFSDLKQYYDDLMNKSEVVKQRIAIFNKLIANTNILFENIVCIYISGKKNTHDKINQLNISTDKKQAKSDIYIEYGCGDFVGWSCKQSDNATKSNYSVHKILGPEISAKLNNIKQELLTTNGFPKFLKSKREDVNKLFYPNKQNPYWNQLRIEIEKNNALIKSVLVDCLYATSIPYPVYEFDGTSILNNTKEVIDQTKVLFEECDAYYMTQKGELRETAKLFYKLCVHDKKYRVEIRWKGNIYTASPQFQIHND
jgi:hypothetical protein